MITLNQEIDSDNLRTETHRNQEHLVAPITILKPMVLNTPDGEAYLPEEEAKKSALAWNGIPLTLNHPSMNDGTPTTANSPGMLENVELGRVFNAESTRDGEVKAEAWLNVDKIEEMGGAALDALNRIRDGKTVEVSSGYQADVASNQKADGKHRDRIQGNIRPDHVAVLPNDRGKCSVEHGCGVGLAANTSLIYTNAMHTDFADDDIVQWDSSGGMAMGRIVDLRDEGEPAYDAEIDGDVTVEPPAALIEVLEETDEGLVPTDTMVAHKTNSDTLSIVEDPAEIVENQMDVPEEFIFDNPGEAVSKAEEMGFGEGNDLAGDELIHTHGEGEETVFMPGPSHEELLQMIEEMSTNADDGTMPEDTGLIENFLSEARTPTFDGTETSSWREVSKTLEDWTDALGVEAETVADMTQAQKQTVAEHTLLGDPEADSWEELRFFPVVNPNTGNLNAGALRAVISGRGETQETVPESAENSAQDMARELLDGEFDSENSGHMDGEEMDDEEEMSDNRLERAFNTLKAIAQTDDEPAESGATADPIMTENGDCECDGESVAQNEETVTVRKDELDALIDERVQERLAANQEESKREELVATITANSEDYTEESLKDTPVDVLENISANVQTGVDFGGARGASPSPATNSEDVDTDISLFGSDA